MSTPVAPVTSQGTAPSLLARASQRLEAARVAMDRALLTMGGGPVVQGPRSVAVPPDLRLPGPQFTALLAHLASEPAPPPTAPGAAVPPDVPADAVVGRLRPLGTTVAPLTRLAADHSASAAKAFVVTEAGRAAIVTVADDWSAAAGHHDPGGELAGRLSRAVTLAFDGHAPVHPRVVVAAHKVLIEWVPVDGRDAHVGVHAGSILDNEGWELFARQAGPAELMEVRAGEPPGPTPSPAMPCTDPLVTVVAGWMMAVATLRPVSTDPGSSSRTGVGPTGIRLGGPSGGGPGLVVAAGVLAMLALVARSAVVGAAATVVAVGAGLWGGVLRPPRVGDAYRRFIDRWGPPVDTVVPPSPYDVLGVDEGASLDEVRARRRALLLVLHPDRHPQAGAEARRCLADAVDVVNAAFREVAAAA